MALVIKGYNEMPKSCDDCPLNYDYILCNALNFMNKGGSFWEGAPKGFDASEGRLPNCPLELKED